MVDTHDLVRRPVANAENRERQPWSVSFFVVMTSKAQSVPTSHTHRRRMIIILAAIPQISNSGPSSRTIPLFKVGWTPWVRNVERRGLYTWGRKPQTLLSDIPLLVTKLRQICTVANPSIVCRSSAIDVTKASGSRPLQKPFPYHVYLLSTPSPEDGP